MINFVFNVFTSVNKLVRERLELQFLEQPAQFVGVGFGHAQRVEVETDRHVGADGCEELREANLLLVLLDLLFQRTLQLAGAFEQRVNRAELLQELDCRLLAHTRTAWYVVGRIAHQSEQVDHLCRRLDAVLLAYAVGVERLVATAVARTVHHHVAAHQLAVVLVGRQHVRLDAFCISLCRQRAYYVVGLEALRLKHRYAHGFQYVLDYGHGAAYVFRRLLALRLVLGVSLAAESGAVWVESHAEIRRFFLRQHFVQCVAEAHHGRRVHAFRVYSRVLYKRVIGPVYQGVSV
ncbi:unknown [Prevotella sp. CAG:1058]|nr:unknown [Prevotella sp. CAG:1058]